MIVSNRRPTTLVARSAFTLLEVLVVVAILLVLASVATVYAVRFLEDAKADATRMKMQAISQACEQYYAKSGNWPASLMDLLQPIDGNEPFLKGGLDAIRDAWQQEIQFTMEYPAGGAGEYVPVLRSVSPDGKRRVVWPPSAQ